MKTTYSNDVSDAKIQKEIQIYKYNESPITFQKGDNVMVNATEMAKLFGKQPVHWLNNNQANEFLTELTKLRNLSLVDLVEVRRGGDNPGTWLHEDVAMEFARWLSPGFAIWCNDRIKELLTTGVATVTNDDEAILYAMQVLQRRFDTQRIRAEYEATRALKLESENKALAPKAEYTDQVLLSTSTFTFTQIAIDLGLRSVHVLTDILEEKGLVYKQSRQWIPTAKVADKGYFATRTYTFPIGDRAVGTSLSTVITERGRKFLHGLINGKGSAK